MSDDGTETPIDVRQLSRLRGAANALAEVAPDPSGTRRPLHSYTAQVQELVGEVRRALDEPRQREFDSLVARRAQSMQPEDAVPVLAAVRGYLADDSIDSLPAPRPTRTGPATIEERRVWRDQFLATLYEFSEADMTRRRTGDGQVTITDDPTSDSCPVAPTTVVVTPRFTG